MGFGFFGKQQAVLEVTTPFHVSGTTRQFAMGNGRFVQIHNNNMHGHFEYVPENTGAVPDQQQIISGIISFNPADFRAYFVALLAQVRPDLANAEFFLASSEMRFIYTSSAALTPATRTMRIKYHRPELMQVFHFHSGNGGTYVQGVFNIPYLPNLKYFTLAFQEQITEIRGRWPEGLTHVYITRAFALASIQRKFPKSLKAAILATSGINSFATGVNTLIEECTELEIFGNLRPIQNGAFDNLMPSPSGTTFNFSHCANMRCLYLYGPNVVAVTHSATALQDLFLIGMTSLPAATFQALVNIFLSSSNRRSMNLRGSAQVWSRNIVDADLNATLNEIYFGVNKFTGSVTLTTARFNVKRFELNTDQEVAVLSRHTFQTVDISGLTGATNINLSYSNIEFLTLPVNTVCTALTLSGNKLSITNNPSLIAQVRAMTAINALIFSSPSTGAIWGQDSADGLGNDVNFDSLALITLTACSCKMTGTLTVQRSAIVTLRVSDNNLAAIVPSSGSNFPNVVELRAALNPLLNFDFTKIPAATTYIVNGIGTAVIDISNRTAITPIGAFIVGGSSVLTQIVFPALAANCIVNTGISISANFSPLLTSVLNLDKISYPSANLLLNSPRDFDFQNNALNMVFPIGTGSFLPASIQIQNNGMSQANVEATLDNIYTNRAKWVGTVRAKSLNIGGTNATPTGTYQAPAGFVLGSNDGTPASIREKIYVLVNNYGWTITYTP